jgi:hypothetical protein
MITIEFTPGQEATVAALAEAHPDQIQQVNVRNATGGGGDLTLIITLAGMALPVVKTAVVEAIRAARYRTFSYKGLKISGHSAADIEKIIAILRKNGIDV